MHYNCSRTTARNGFTPLRKAVFLKSWLCFNAPELLIIMTKKQKRKSVDRENLSPMAKLKLNQRIKSTESMLSGDELDAFRKLSQSEKRDVVKEVLRKAANSAIDAEIIDYFKQLNSGNWDLDILDVNTYK